VTCCHIVRFSPPTWGWSEAQGLQRVTGHVLPSGVGMVRGTTVRQGNKTLSPHCGDGPVQYQQMVQPQFVFPTGVGMVLTMSTRLVRLSSCPHTCGDGPDPVNDINIACKFSPHVWGWSGFIHIAPETLGVFPTYVGMVRR
jgi:hypothetical protein